MFERSASESEDFDLLEGVSPFGKFLILLGLTVCLVLVAVDFSKQSRIQPTSHSCSSASCCRAK